MKLMDILPSNHISIGVTEGSKKRVLEYLAHFLSDRLPGANEATIYQGFLERERLGSTGIGSGIAIPHTRLPGCKKITGVFLQLATPIDYDAVDQEPIDLVFALVVPDEENAEHLQVLSLIASCLQEEKTRTKLRQAHTADAVEQILSRCDAADTN